MNFRLLLLAATLAAPAQALELGQPEIRFEPDCTALLTLQLAAEAGVDPDQIRVEIASPPTYRKLEKAYPSWVGSARWERIRRNGEERIQVRSTEPLPAHSTDLVLVLGEGYEPPTFYNLNLPPCAPAGTMRKVVWGDTLLEIALEQARSQEVDAYTLMLAIQLYNRGAFIHDNINLIRAGTQLYIPSQAEISRLNLSRQWLIDEIQFQNKQWRKWRREGTDLRESSTLRERRLQLVPLEMQAEPAIPEPSVLEPTKAEPAEPGTTGAQPAVPTEPEPATSEPPPEPEAEPSAMAKFTAKILAPLKDWLGGEPATPEPDPAELATPEPTAPEPDPAEPATPEPSALEPTVAEPAEPETTGAQPAVPTEPEPEPATPEPTVPEPDPAEPAAPELSALEPTIAEPAEPGTTGAQPAVPTEPEPAASEPPPAAPAEPEAEKTEAPSAMARFTAKILAPLTGWLGGEPATPEPTAPEPDPVEPATPEPTVPEPDPAELATPEPTVPEPDPAEPAAPEPSPLEPTIAEPAEPGTTGAQPAVPTEPEPAASEPPPATPAEPEAEKTETPSAMAKFKAKILAPLTGWLGGEPATPEPTVPEPDPAEPAAPEPSALEPTIAEPAEPETTGAQPVVPTEPEPEPEPAASEPPPAAPAEPEAEKTEAPPAVVEIEPKVLMPPADRLGGEGAVAKMAADLPWPGILAAVGILLLTYLFAFALSRARLARIIRESVGDIEDPARRATSALDLAHAHVEANEYDQAHALIRLVLAEGTEQERKEAEKLKSRIASS